MFFKTNKGYDTNKFSILVCEKFNKIELFYDGDYTEPIDCVLYSATEYIILSANDDFAQAEVYVYISCARKLVKIFDSFTEFVEHYNQFCVMPF